MEKFIRLLGILFNISGVVSAFGKEYVLAVILILLGLSSIIATSIESVIKTKEKTKQIEKEENEKTKRTEIVEEGRTERTRIIASETTQQLKTLSDIYNNISTSMPPEELQKLNNSNVVYISEYLRNRLTDIVPEKYIEDEIPSDKDKQNESDKSSNQTIDGDDVSEDNKNKLLELGEKILKQLENLKKDGSNGN